MRKLTILLFTLLVFPAMASETPKATPLPVLLEQPGIKDGGAHSGHHQPHVMPQAPATTVNAAPPASVNATARTFNLSAVQFRFIITPSPFVVNQGDQVTLNITAEDTTHGFFLDVYDMVGAPIAEGRTRTVTFTAHTAGTFTFFCTFQCGEGHGIMNGVFTVNQAAAPPTITSIAPTSGPAGGGTTVVITGSNFQNSAAVKFGTIDAISATLTSSTSITAVAPAQAAGKVNITVTNPDGTSATFDGYTYQSTAPTITSISPDNGPIAGGTVVTISGSNFQNGATVRFGSTPGSVTFISSGQLTVVTPPLGVGPVVVTVTNPNGETVTGSYLYTGPVPQRRRATKRG